MNVAAGEYNRKTSVHARVAGVDAANQPLDTFDDTPLFSPWAKILGESGMSVVRAALDGTQIPVGKYSFRIRYRPTGIDTGMQLRYKAMRFNIVGIRHDLDRQQHTDLICEFGATNG